VPPSFPINACDTVSLASGPIRRFSGYSAKLSQCQLRANGPRETMYGCAGADPQIVDHWGHAAGCRKVEPYKFRLLRLGLLWVLLFALCFVCPAWASDGNASSEPESCIKCHAAEGLPDGGGRDLGPHADLSCTDCHEGADTFPHELITLTPCLSCHEPHNEETSGDLHAGVTCSACHLAGTAGSEAPHLLLDAKAETSCQRCHHPSNKMRASAMVLPPKSALCLACHTATLSIKDWPSRIALGLLAIGLLGSLGFWLSGGNQGPTSGHGHGHALRPGSFISAFFMDGLFQRRLWHLSRGRWVIHCLIFLPFFARTAWALTALVLGRWDVSGELTQAMLNKNDAFSALFFDTTGVMVLAGVGLAIARRVLLKKKPLPGLPRPDWLVMGLLAAIVLSGFVTEGARIAMTGVGASPPYAFLGAALSRLFTAGPGLQEAYGYLWYAHAICYAAFVAYLPFSRMKHIILAPFSAALRSAGGSGRASD
jgi:hypothetical protein